MPSNAPWMLCLLDQFRLEQGGTEVLRFYDRRQDQVLAYLAMHRQRPMSRLDMAMALWPDKDPRLARGRLSECLHYIKRELAGVGAPDAWIKGNRHVVELDTSLDTDVRDFEIAVAGAIADVAPERQIELLEKALKLYGEGLLPGLGGEWVVGERNRMVALYETAARQLARSLESAGAFEATPEFAQHLAPEDLARQWVKSRSLMTVPPPPSPASDVAEPWVPGKSLDALERRLADRAVSIAEQAEPHLWGPERAEWLARLDAEYSNIEVALRWAIEAKERETALALSSALWPYWQVRGRVAEGLELAESALDLGSLGRSALEAKAIHGAGVLAMLSGNLGGAESRLRRARERWIEQDEPIWLARSLISSSVVAYRQSDYVAARDLVGQAISNLRERGHDDLLIRALKDAALVEIAEEQFADADKFLAEALQLAREGFNAAAEARVLGNMSTVAQHRDKYDEARRLTERAISILSAEDDLPGVAFCLRNLGSTCLATGDYESSLSYLEDSIRLSEILGNDWAVGESRLYMGRLMLAQDLTEDALAQLTQSLALFEASGDAEGAGEARNEIAAIESD